MNRINSNFITIKWIISIVFSIGIGTFTMNILENIELNIWIARIVGALVTAIIELVFYYFWIKKSKN